jgi:hypothetical protein
MRHGERERERESAREKGFKQVFSPVRLDLCVLHSLSPLTLLSPCRREEKPKGGSMRYPPIGSPS